jgi:DNA topoisomerase I
VLPVGNQREVKRQLKKVISDVAGRLGNTATICRKCYIHPEVLLGYAQGRLAGLPRTSSTHALRSLLGKRKRNSAR